MFVVLHGRRARSLACFVVLRKREKIIIEIKPQPLRLLTSLGTHGCLIFCNIFYPFSCYLPPPPLSLSLLNWYKYRRINDSKRGKLYILLRRRYLLDWVYYPGLGIVVFGWHRQQVKRTRLIAVRTASKKHIIVVQRGRTTEEVV